MPEKVEGAYGAEQIQVLDGLEHIRKRPGMYISSTDERGLPASSRERGRR